MKIEDIASVPKYAICKLSNKHQKIHDIPKTGGRIVSWYDKEGNLEERDCFDSSGNGFRVRNYRRYIEINFVGKQLYSIPIIIGRLSKESYSEVV